MEVEKTIIDLEKEALNEWSGGDAKGYLINGTEDTTYCDNLGAELVIGRENVLNYVGKMFADLPEHKYEMANIHVQHYDNTAILSYQYQPFTLDDEPQTKWSATVVYILTDAAWGLVHAHWTMLQKPS